MLRSPEFWVAALTLSLGSAVGLGLVPAASSPASPTAVAGSVPAVAFLPIALWNSAVLVMLLLGTVTGGLSALVTLFVTGFQTGLTMAAALASGMAPSTVATLIVPHASFELIGLLLAGALGLRGFRLLLGTRCEADEHFVSVAIGSLALILVGAAIESLLTPWIAGL